MPLGRPLKSGSEPPKTEGDLCGLPLTYEVRPSESPMRVVLSEQRGGRGPRNVSVRYPAPPPPRRARQIAFWNLHIGSLPARRPRRSFPARGGGGFFFFFFFNDVVPPAFPVACHYRSWPLNRRHATFAISPPVYGNRPAHAVHRNRDPRIENMLLGRIEILPETAQDLNQRPHAGGPGPWKPVQTFTQPR